MSAGADPTNRRPIRGAIAITLAVIASIFVSMAVDAFWLDKAIFDADGFVERVAPLPKDPAVSTAIAASTVLALTEDGALQAQIADALPDQLSFLASTFAEFAAELVFDLTKALVESDVFTSVWTAIAEATHRALTAALQGRSGDVSFDLGIGAELIVNRLEESGITLFSDLTIGEIVLLQADQLAGPRAIANVFDTSLWLFPLIALVLLAAAVAVDWDQRRSIEVFGFSVATAVLASAALLAGTRTVFVRGGDTTIVREAAGWYGMRWPMGTWCWPQRWPVAVWSSASAPGWSATRCSPRSISSWRSNARPRRHQRSGSEIARVPCCVFRAGALPLGSLG